MSDSPKPSPSGVGRWGPLIIVGVCLVGYFFLTRPAGAIAGWSTDFDAALATAKKENKSLLVAFHSQSCPPCYAMERTVLHEDPVVETMKGLVAVRVDPNQRADLSERFNIVGTPMYLLLSPTEEVISQRMGYVPADEFVIFLSQAFDRTKSAQAEAPPPSEP